MAPVRSAQLLLVSLFALGLFVPGLAMLTPLAPGGDASEKRVLAAFPDWSSEAAADFPRKVDDYVRDRFGLRDLLIRWGNRWRVQVLHTSPVRNAILGRDGWLFYGAYGDGADIRDHLGRLPLSLADGEARKRTILERRDRFAALGITYLFVVVPDKQTIYPERAGLRRGSRRPATRLDHFVAQIESDPSIPFLDLRAALSAARAQRDLYYRTDSHWNLYGGFVGFQAILRRLATMRSDIPVIPDDYARFIDRPAPGGDVAALLSLSDVLGDLRQDVEWSDETTQSPLRVVLVGDSFAESLHPFFELRFAYINPFDEAIGATRGRPHFDIDAVLAQRPDIVIEQHVERYLTTW